MQHLQISGIQTSNDKFVSETLIYSILNFTQLLDVTCTLTQLYVLYTKQLFSYIFTHNYNCAVTFYPLFLSINFNIETTVMVM